MTISVIISIGQDVIQVYNDKNVKLLCKDLVDISLKRHHLILKVAVLSPERNLLLVSFADSHLIVGTGKVKLYKWFNFS